MTVLFRWLRGRNRRKNGEYEPACGVPKRLARFGTGVRPAWVRSLLVARLGQIGKIGYLLFPNPTL